MSNEKFVYTEEVTGEIVNISVKLLHHHHDNPRKDLGDLSELTVCFVKNSDMILVWLMVTKANLLPNS